jgi:rare lipoprotein A (peptidoglycan hydrolase)
MMAQAAGLMPRPHALYLPSRAASRMAPSFRWPAITLGAVRFGAIRFRNSIGVLKLAAGIAACAAATLAIVTSQQGRQDTSAIEGVRNETIVLRQEQQAYMGTEQVKAADDQEVDVGTVPSNFPRMVQTIRFVNPLHNIGTKGERVSKGKPHMINGRTYVPTDSPAYRAEGIASWYGPDFHGRLTANGERYDMQGISAAHRTMPLPSYARVTDLDNGRSIIVRVNNRGPFVHNRIIDLSVGTAKALDFYKNGTAHVRVEFVGPAPIEGGDDQMLLATLRAGTPAPAPANVMVASAKPFLPKNGDGKELGLPSEH